MDLLYKYLNEVFSLTEGKLDILKNKYKNISSEDVERIYSEDPSKGKKYSDWMMRQFLKGASIEDISSTIKRFEKNQNKLKIKDIYQYKDIRNLKNDLSPFLSRKEKKESGVKIYEDDEVVVIRPDSKDACMIYGTGTKWCITQKEETHYEDYKQNNVIFYYLISKKYDDQKYSKIAFAFQRDLENNIVKFSIFDAQDDDVTVDLLDKLYENSNKIIEICKTDAKEQPQSLLSKIISGNYEREDLDEYMANFDINGRFFINQVHPKIRKEDIDIVLSHISEETDVLAVDFIKRNSLIIENDQMKKLLDKVGLDFVASIYEDLDYDQIEMAPHALVNAAVESKDPQFWSLIFFSKIGRKYIEWKWVNPIEEQYKLFLTNASELIGNLEKAGTTEKSGEILLKITKDEINKVSKYHLKNMLLPEREFYRIHINLKDFLSSIKFLEGLIDYETFGPYFEINQSIKNNIKNSRENLDKLSYILNAYLSKNFDF